MTTASSPRLIHVATHRAGDMATGGAADQRWKCGMLVASPRRRSSIDRTRNPGRTHPTRLRQFSPTATGAVAASLAPGASPRRGRASASSTNAATRSWPSRR